MLGSVRLSGQVWVVESAVVGLAAMPDVDDVDHLIRFLPDEADPPLSGSESPLRGPDAGHLTDITLVPFSQAAKGFDDTCAILPI